MELFSSLLSPSPALFGIFIILALALYLTIISRRKAAKAKALLLKAASKRKQRDSNLNIPLPELNLTPQKIEKILNASVVELSKMLNDDQVTSEQLLLVFCERVKTIGLSYELIADADFEPALQMARECDKKLQSTPKDQRKDLGPLFGIPVSIKDNFRLKGLDSTFGIAQRCFNPETQDAVSVEVLKRYGAVPFVKSNGPQMMMTIESVNNIFGRSRNPWNPERTVGGSSGGEGGLVAARCSPLGLGSDIGGSVRIPALYCGVYGMKGTAERLSSKGIVYPNKAGRNGNTLIKSVIGPLGKCVDDVREAMKVLMSKELSELDPKSVHIPWNREWEEKPLPKLRIGYIDNDDFFEVCPTNKRAVMETCEALKKKGHDVISLNGVLPGFQRSYLTYSGIFSAEGKLRSFFNGLDGEPMIQEYHQWVKLVYIPTFLRNMLAKVLDFVGQKRASSMLRASDGKKAHELFEYVKEMESMRDEIIQLWKDNNLDAIITPGLALPAVHHGKAHSLYINSCYTALWNLVNFPTGNVPVTKVKEDETKYHNENRKHKGDSYDVRAMECLKDAVGLPCGVQLTTLPFEEEKCLAIMKAVEDEINFHEFPL